MTVNVGNIDRILRIVIGVVLVTLAATGIFSPWGWLGVVLVITGLMKFCPFYALFGMSSCPAEKK